MPRWLIAGLWGGVAGGALLLGAAAGYLAPVPRRIVAGIMAFGAGVLISALAFDLMDEALARGGFAWTAGGFLAGAVLYSGANWLLARRGAKHRKRSGAQPSETDAPGSGVAIAVGALIDGIPESIALGLTFVAGGAVSVPMIAAVFLSNLPEGMASSVGMKAAGRSARYIFGVWTAIALVSAVAAVIGFTVFGRLGPQPVAATVAVAAGAILTMLADTMMPEAFEQAHELVGLITVLGFLAAFALTKLS